MTAESARPDPVSDNHDLDELEAVCAWRTRVLLDAGYPIDLAFQLGALAWHHVDLHTAVEFVTVRHCSPQLAAEILL